MRQTVETVALVTFWAYVLGSGIVVPSIVTLTLFTGEKIGTVKVVTWTGWIAVGVVVAAIARLL